MENQNIVYVSFHDEEECSKCKKVIEKGDFVSFKDKSILCLACCHMDHLILLASGDATLTRRVQKYSSQTAVIMKYSRARKRNERQGLLIEQAAFYKAERELADEAIKRVNAQIKSGAPLSDAEAKYQKPFLRRLRREYPNCPSNLHAAIVDHAYRRNCPYDDFGVLVAVMTFLSRNLRDYAACSRLDLDPSEIHDQTETKVRQTMAQWQGEKRP